MDLRLVHSMHFNTLMMHIRHCTSAMLMAYTEVARGLCSIQSPLLLAQCVICNNREYHQNGRCLTNAVKAGLHQRLVRGTSCPSSSLTTWYSSCR